MAIIETKYSIGDVVFFASTTTERRQHPCPDCLGTKKWKAISPAGSEYEFECPRCRSGYRSEHDLSLDYTIFAPATSRLTIGSVRTDSTDKNSYMCRETGVGSGSVYDEARLFATEAEAHAAAQATEPLNTTLILADFSQPSSHIEHLAFHEAVPGYTIDDAVADILSGEKIGFIRAVYTIAEGEATKDVSAQVADRICAAWIAGQFVSQSAREFVDYMGREVREAAE